MKMRMLPWEISEIKCLKKLYFILDKAQVEKVYFIILVVDLVNCNNPD